MQVEAVAFVPVDSGNLRNLLASSEALLIERRTFGPYVEFGFRTKRLRKQGYYAVWVEQGTKGHTKGEVVRPGRDGRSRSGKPRKGRRTLRSVPARPAQPFMRPAFERFKERMERARSEILRKAAQRSGFRLPGF